MPEYRMPIPPALQNGITDDAAEAITNYLEGQGFTVSGVRVRTPPAQAVPPIISGTASGVTVVPVDPGPPALIIDANTDPTAAIAAYAGQPSARKIRLQQAKTLALAYRDKVVNNEPVTALESARAIAATITLIEFLAKAD